MSPARTRAGRGTWRPVATLAFSLALPLGGIAGAWQAPSVVPAEARPAEAKPAQAQVEPVEKKAKPTVADMIRDAFGKRAKAALAVARCESKLDPKARSRAGARGVFQIMPVHSWRIARVDGKDLYDAQTNVDVARDLYDDEGWRPWVCARIVGVR